MIHALLRGFLPVFAALVFASSAGAAPTPARTPEPTPPDVVTPKLEELLGTQQSLAAEVGKLQEQVRGLEGRVGELQDLLRSVREDASGAHEPIKPMREEVRGLYWESSSTKEMISKAGEQVDKVNTGLDRFRAAAGGFFAVMVVLQAIGIALAFRGRG